MKKIPKFLLLLLLGVVCFTASLEAQVSTVPTSYEGVQYTAAYPSNSATTNYTPGLLKVGYRNFSYTSAYYYTIFTLDLTGFILPGTTVYGVDLTWTNGGFTSFANSGSLALCSTSPPYGAIDTNNLGSGNFATNGSPFSPSASIVLTGNTNLTSLVQANLGSNLTIYGYGYGEVTGGSAQFSLNLSPAPEPSSYALLGISAIGIIVAFRFRKRKMDFWASRFPSSILAPGRPRHL